MDGVYRYQRHIYDLTRKYYLLGRDRLIAGLDAGDGSVLEIGCGTGRNLVLAARRFPAASFCGLDISSAMLEKAEAAVRRDGLSGRVALARADACDFDAWALFGREGFDRVFLSYSLSMIPDWEAALDAGLAAVAPGGSLHLVDFGRQEKLPAWFRTSLRRWLSKFHVEPRDSMREALESRCRQTGASLRFDSLFGGYAVVALVTKR
jgi:S-adenosylmethionine-diacylgycerolhomoserine-N-methlytransferase